jgi:hypothetical protein
VREGFFGGLGMLYVVLRRAYHWKVEENTSKQAIKRMTRNATAVSRDGCEVWTT